MYAINCKGSLLVFDAPKIMGIINITPDSFYKNSLQNNGQQLVDAVGLMLQQGAHIIDIGGQSTRPGSTLLTAEQEADRVLPALQLLHANFKGAIFSIDTFYAEVAKQAVLAGAAMVNDISGGTMDAQMLPTIGGLRVPYVCTHIQGTPQTMQQQPHYNNVVLDIIDFFAAKLIECRAAGIVDVIIDPGFGFGKTLQHNYSLLKHFADLKILDAPLLAGISRKGMIQKVINKQAADALNGTTAAHTLALLNGANMLRVHDVSAAKEAIDIVDMYKSAT